MFELKQGFTRLAIHGPEDRKLTADEAKSFVAERVNAWAKLSGEKFVTGRNYGLGRPGSYNMYYAYFKRSVANIHVSEDWAYNVSTLVNDDEHTLCD